ncbi:TetR/AcrR family transcriptional regulator [Rhodococcus sp. ABRD24]|uniref:TetR/AcrR family transcriptional regulator n=1 Tax=Rhodococcus sp. ABRD24 TaxID=2507582 RepID=UPI0010408CBB|nr:TetR/AcrR family transcriptional regulator [Rhodococcus sp. ABRD24]QBJ97465.1 TetR/AcrR family transcriptional regulator [Rhodococcus sp. ABRD24]
MSSRTRSPKSSRPIGDAEQRLLDAARDAFADKGYHGTSTREIAAGAGMSPAAMYIHFRSKQDILARLSLEGHVTALAALTDSVQTPSSPTKRLRAAVYAFAHWHAENTTTARVVQYELSHLDPDSHAQVVQLRHDIVTTVRSIIEDGTRDGEFAVDNIDTTTLAVLSLCIDTARWYPSRELHSPDAVGAALAALAQRMVGAIEPTPAPRF